MSTKKPLDVISILRRAKHYLGLKTDSDLAKAMDLKPSTVAMWRKRETIDIQAMLTICDGASSDWLLYGRGPMKAGPGDDLTQRILGMLEEMDEDAKRDVLRYTQKAELIEALMRERKKA